MEIFIAAGIFLGVLLTVEGLFYLLQAVRKPEDVRVRRRVKGLSKGEYHKPKVNILRTTTLSEIPWLNTLLFRIPNILRMSRFLEQANAKFPVSVYVLVGVVMGLGAYLVAKMLGIPLLVRVVLALACALSPFLSLYIKKTNRMNKFQRQLPEALEMIARALKAGHAFPGGLNMASEEFDDPIGTELGKTLEEMNFGVSIPVALKNLAGRVDCSDLKFFVISVIIQRETGGNLAEIMENLAQLIRERFKLQGKVQTLAAEGKFSAVILMVIPLLVGFYFYLVQPRYLSLLFTDPIGHVMVTAVVIMMIIGTYVMKRIVTIRV